MTSTLACPSETELLALAMGEPDAATVRSHVDACTSCRAKLNRLQAEVAMLRQNHGDATTPPSAEDDPTVDHDGEPSAAGTTEDWKSPDLADTPGDEPTGSETVVPPGGRAEGQGPMPDAIGRYKVIDLIDIGGEADVYRVVHIKLGNNLVLKLSRQRVGADSRPGLAEVGRLLVDLEHPNLVRIYDLDVHEDRPFLVMEYVHGLNLEQHAKEQPVSPQRAAALVTKLAGVMALAHRHGITHCDIKPKNILIDKLGEPRLIDFGMARLRHAWTNRVETVMGGTVAYMAPEQANLEIDRIGPRSDIFALGGVLYFLLNGHAPFVGRNQSEVWDRARRCDFDAGALNDPKVPAGLRRICLKAMSEKPADRYPSAEELQKALYRVTSGPTIRARAVGVAALALLGAMIYALWPPPRPSAEARQKESVVIPHAPQAMALTGELIVRVWSKENGAKRGLEVTEAGALPLRAGEQVRLEPDSTNPRTRTCCG